MKRLVTGGLVALMPCLAIVSGQAPSYRYDLSFTPKPVVLNEPFSCVADKRATISFFGEPNTEVEASCTVTEPFKVRILTLFSVRHCDTRRKIIRLSVADSFKACALQEFVNGAFLLDFFEF
jgi:hypothetical protein